MDLSSGSTPDGNGVAALVDQGQLRGELGEEDDGENGCGENEGMTATGLFIDEGARDSCIGSNGRSCNGAPLDAGRVS